MHKCICMYIYVCVCVDIIFSGQILSTHTYTHTFTHTHITFLCSILCAALAAPTSGSLTEENFRAGISPYTHIHRQTYMYTSSPLILHTFTPSSGAIAPHRQTYMYTRREARETALHTRTHIHTHTHTVAPELVPLFSSA